MDLVIDDSGGPNIVAREMGEPEWYQAATVDAHEVELFVQELDPVTRAFVGAPIFRGRFPAEGQVVIDRNPDSDRDAVVYVMPYAADGTAGYSDIRDAQQTTILCRRETEAPEIGQNAPATTDAVEIGITGFTRFARHRRITVSENADMSDPLVTLVLDSDEYAARELPRYFVLTREAGALTTEGGGLLTTEGGELLAAEDDAAALPLTAYVTVSHSSGVAWTPESNILEITFAAGDGSGGSAGDFDPTPRDFRGLETV